MKAIVSQIVNNITVLQTVDGHRYFVKNLNYQIGTTGTLEVAKSGSFVCGEFIPGIEVRFTSHDMNHLHDNP